MDWVDPAMNYREAISNLLSLVDHEREAPAEPRQKRIYDLHNLEFLLERLGDPHRLPGVVHVAGTKGKGSTAAMIESILRAAGHSTGFYSSPHLHSFCERIRLNGAPVSPERFAALTGMIWPSHLANSADPEAGATTLFEYLTAMAFQCFADERTDCNVIEVGLGGKLDATNVVTPSVGVITPVSLDHTAILGDTIGEIAADKAGIIKRGVPVVVAPQFPEAMAAIRLAAANRPAELVAVDARATWTTGAVSAAGQELTVRTERDTYSLRLPLLGDFQGANAAVAVVAAETLISQGYDIPHEAVVSGLGSVQWPARLEVLCQSPSVVADGAHNDHSVATVLATLQKSIPHERLIVVAGFSRDKRVTAMVELLAQRADRVIATRSRHPRSMRPASILDEFAAHDFPVDRITHADYVGTAIERAMEDADERDLILVTGSLFVAAEARESVLGIEPETYPDLVAPDLR